MTDLPPNTGGDSGAGHDRGAVTGTPRWVKLFGIIALVLILLFAIMMLTGRGGGHGPGNHAPSRGAADHTLASNGYDHTGGAGWSGAVRVITLESMTFEPGRSKVAPGETIAFVMTNTSRAVPEFTLGDAGRGPTNATLPPGRAT